MTKEKTKWRWNEYSEWKDKQEQKDEPVETPVRSGTCEKCGCGSFKLKTKDGKMDRICKNCGEVLEDV